VESCNLNTIDECVVVLRAATDVDAVMMLPSSPACSQNSLSSHPVTNGRQLLRPTPSRGGVQVAGVGGARASHTPIDGDITRGCGDDGPCDDTLPAVKPTGSAATVVLESGTGVDPVRRDSTPPARVPRCHDLIGFMSNVTDLSEGAAGNEVNPYAPLKQSLLDTPEW
jgi:hypothetical protein